MPPHDAVVAILRDYWNSSAADRHATRPIIIERLHALGVKRPERLLGEDATDEAAPQGGGGPSQATMLLGLLDNVDLWHTADGEPYATLCRDGHLETYRVRSRALSEYLRWLYHTGTRRALRAESLREVISVLEARARYDGAEHRAWLRVAQQDGAIYLDLGDPTWRAVQITSDGWRIVTDPPVRFRRSPGMLALPEPARGGSLASLRALLRVERDDDWLMVVGWLLAALRPRGPYPVLALGGEPGAAKSTTARIVRGLVDPNVAALRAEPREARDLIVAAQHGHVVALDNVSRLPPSLSDALCRMSTGGGWSARALYTDTDEVLVDVQRPVIVTAIEEVCTRSDLADRTLPITLPAMAETARRSEDELWSKVAAALPGILGALLDALVCGLREVPRVTLDRMPRMADFAKWIAACEPALGVNPGTMIAAYTRTRQSVTANTIDASPVALALLEWLAHRPAGATWDGTATELLSELARHAPGTTVCDHQLWPQSPRALSGSLRRLAPALRGAGVFVDWPPRGGNRRGITVTTVTTATPPGAEGGGSDGPSDGCDDTRNQPSREQTATSADDDDGDGRDGHAHGFAAADDVVDL